MRVCECLLAKPACGPLTMCTACGPLTMCAACGPLTMCTACCGPLTICTMCTCHVAIQAASELQVLRDEVRQGEHLAAARSIENAQLQQQVRGWVREGVRSRRRGAGGLGRCML